MTSNWQKFKRKDAQPIPDISAMALEVPGSFGCQICYEQVDGAEYFQVSRVLRWKCSQGHISLIEKFDL